MENTCMTTEVQSKYERIDAHRELCRLLDEGIAFVKAGQSWTAEDVFAGLEKRFCPERK